MSSLPHSPEAEGALIARLLVEPSLIPTLVGSITSGDFHDDTYGRAWAVMESRAGDARRVDATTLKASGVDLGDPLEFLGRATSAPVEEYARIIRFHASQRNAITSLRTAERAIRNAKDESDVYGAVQGAVSTVLSQHRGGGSLVSLREAVAGYRHEVGGLSWGFVSLDRAIQPVRPGQMVVLAARPSVGKTLVAEHIAMSWSEGSDHPVLFVSVEMSVPQLLARAESRYGDLSSIVEGHNLVFLDEPRATTAIVRSQASRLRVQHGGVRAIVIDYLQLLRDPGEPEHIRVGRISGECKAMSREFECPVLVLSQLNRLSESREDRRPKLADLRDSGAIEQDADLVMMLYRPRLNSPDMELSVAKNRQGPAGFSVSLEVDLEKVSILG